MTEKSYAEWRKAFAEIEDCIRSLYACMEKKGDCKKNKKTVANFVQTSKRYDVSKSE